MLPDIIIHFAPALAAAILIWTLIHSPRILTTAGNFIDRLCAPTAPTTTPRRALLLRVQRARAQSAADNFFRARALPLPSETDNLKEHRPTDQDWKEAREWADAIPPAKRKARMAVARARLRKRLASPYWRCFAESIRTANARIIELQRRIDAN